MSSGSSDNDVIRTRIPAYEDDNTVLYAYEPSNTYASNQESAVSDTSYNEEQQKTVLDILSHCQAIYDAIQNLDRKLDVMHGKVTKIHRFRLKTMWQNRKPLGYAYKNYSYLLSRKIKYHKMRKKEPPSTFSYPESYSPTLPVERQDNESDVQGNPTTVSFQSEVPSEPEQPLFREQEEEPGPGESPQLPSIFEHSFEPYFSPDDPMPGPSTMPCFSSRGAPSTASVVSSARASTVAASAAMIPEERSPASNADLNYSLLENKSISQRTNSSVCVPPCFVAHSPAGLDVSNSTQSFSKDPSSWSVEEVIQFMEQTDPQTFTSLADLFRHHDIDGKALLLLKSDMMMKYMGLKLGTAVKLCHYIERLKQEKYFHG